jgi:hypothetical protein
LALFYFAKTTFQLTSGTTIWIALPEPSLNFGDVCFYREAKQRATLFHPAELGEDSGQDGTPQPISESPMPFNSVRLS